MFLHEPPDSAGSARLYDGDREELGYVMNASRLWAWSPEICEAFRDLRLRLMKDSTLPRRELAVLVCATASSMRDSYCSLAWGAVLTKTADARTAAGVLAGTTPEALSARESALLAWARKIVRDPNSTTADDVAALRCAGLSEREIFEATAFVAFRLAFSTVNDALGAAPDAPLAAECAPEVRAAVTYGRPPAASPEAPA